MHDITDYEQRVLSPAALALRLLWALCRPEPESRR